MNRPYTTKSCYILNTLCQEFWVRYTKAHALTPNSYPTLINSYTTPFSPCSATISSLLSFPPILMLRNPNQCLTRSSWRPFESGLVVKYSHKSWCFTSATNFQSLQLLSCLMNVSEWMFRNPSQPLAVSIIRHWQFVLVISGGWRHNLPSLRVITRLVWGRRIKNVSFASGGDRVRLVDWLARPSWGKVKKCGLG